MTVVTHFRFTAADVIALRLTCAGCHTTAAAAPTDWKKIPERCPNCERTWFQSDDAVQKQMFAELKDALVNFTGASKDMQVSFEVAAPTG